MTKPHLIDRINMGEYKAAFLTGPQQISMGSLPLPELKPNEVLVRLEKANLCPTDLKKYYQLDEKSARLLQLQGGLILGHEAAGAVAAVGSEVSGIDADMRVAIDPMLPCGTCAYCRSGDFPMCKNLKGIGVSAGSMADSIQLLAEGVGGTFAEYVKVPAKNIYPLPEGLSFEAGALMEPLADVLHSLEAGAPKPGEMAVVFGLGAMGLMHIRAMSAWGLDRIIGIDPIAQRCQKALEFGASHTIDPMHEDPVAKLIELSDGLGAEVIFVCAGGSAQKLCAQQALQAIRKKGRILLYASALKPADISVDINQIHYGMIRFTGTVGFYRRHAEQALKLLVEGTVDVHQIRTPSLPLQKLAEAFSISDRSEVVNVGIDIVHD
jgi:threonine dehydrogenase-like Zn-dependent dehydrogenase